MHSPLLRCPRCGQVDAVQKVSAIIASNQSYELYTHDGHLSHANESLPFTNKNGSLQTPLSERLAFPERHHGCSLALLLLFAALLAPGSAIVTWITYSAGSNNQAPEQQATLFLNISLTLACIAIAIVSSLLRSRRKQLDKPRRERALAIWNTLYYCHRDDTVFVADNPLQLATSHTMHTLLGY